MAVSCLPDLGILLSLVCTLRLCGLIVANPIIHRLVPSPSRFENHSVTIQILIPALTSLRAHIQTCLASQLSCFQNFFHDLVST